MSLLQHLANTLDCTYLSDLHYIQITEPQKAQIAAIEETAYPLPEWNEAASYVSGYKVPFSSCEEAKQALLCGLSKEK